MNIFSLIESVKHLIFGRPVPPKEKLVVVDIKKNAKPLPKPKQRASASIKVWNGERIIVLPFEDPKLVVPFINQHTEMVYRYILKKVERAISKNKTDVTLFQFGNSDQFVRLKSNSLTEQLTKMRDFFSRIEDYESASRCRDLIKQISK